MKSIIRTALALCLVVLTTCLGGCGMAEPGTVCYGAGFSHGPQGTGFFTSHGETDTYWDKSLPSEPIFNSHAEASGQIGGNTDSNGNSNGSNGNPGYHK